MYGIPASARRAELYRVPMDSLAADVQQVSDLAILNGRVLLEHSPDHVPGEAHLVLVLRSGSSLERGDALRSWAVCPHLGFSFNL
jgi:hypothetical protein